MEITLYTYNGEPIAYLDIQDEGTFWLWEGRAVAYLQKEAIFGWNGEHLGWFIGNIIYDTDGYQVGYTSETCPKFTRFEPFKKFKRFKRFKRFQRFTKSKPSLKNSVSKTSLKAFLESGAVD